MKERPGGTSLPGAGPAYRLLVPPPCGMAREGWPALPPAAEFVLIVSAGLPFGEIVAAFGAPVEPDCGATTGPVEGWAPGAAGVVCARAAPDRPARTVPDRMR